MALIIIIEIEYFYISIITILVYSSAGKLLSSIFALFLLETLTKTLYKIYSDAIA